MTAVPAPLPAFVPTFSPYGSGPATSADELPSATALPVGEAEALLAAVPGIISARVVPTRQGGVSEVHVLTGAEVPPRQTVRAVESALFARFGVRVEQRRISVATTTGPVRRPAGATAARSVSHAESAPSPAAAPIDGARRSANARRLYFEDVEARRSMRGGVSCRVVLRRGEALASEADVLVEGEAESTGTLRVQADEVAARAALDALARGEAAAAAFAFEGSARVTAFGREFVLVGVVARQGRGATLLTGSAEVRDGGAEVAAVLAILDATNRWVGKRAA
ncbi:hypothetical protein tb265_05220 [Gemmatimonadetes bacterium T265]|nr:hypothetical protein tb265_05220 [Gemmatimonadetes bacterium T265]